MNSTANVSSKPDVNFHSKEAKKNSVINFILNQIVLPIRAGIYGFVIIFAVLAITEFFAYILNYDDKFSIDMSDILLSLVGFVCLFLIYYLKNHKKD